MQSFPRSLIRSSFKSLIQFQTENPPSFTKNIVNYLKNWFKEQNIPNSTVHAYQKDGTPMHNLVTTLGTGSKKIILCGHLDTVPAGNIEDWDNPPFEAVEKQGIIYGRGSADMKGGVAGILGTMLMLQDEKDFLKEYQLVFAGTADEEAGMSGAAYLQQTGLMQNARCLIIPEATNLQVGISEKGVFWSKITVHGKAAHGSMPQEGINAIEGAARLMPKLHGLLDQNLQNKWLGQSTLNIGKIHGGNATNVVPDRCTIETDFRLIPEEYNNFETKLRTLLSNFEYQSSVEIGNNLTPIQSDLKFPFIQNLLHQSKAKPSGMTYATDAAKLIGVLKSPIPFVIFGPGDPTIIHKVNEHIKFEDVAQFSIILAESLLATYSS